ncbi:MAG: hypothetical protein AB1437_02025 [Pseudomonadota bacterium]
MRKFIMPIAAACLLAAPFVARAECSRPVSRLALVDASRQAASPMGGGVHGLYTLSNGQRLRLVDHYGDLVAIFEGRQLVRLEEAGLNRYASREGDVQLSWTPREGAIQLHYQADSQGRLQRSCE